LSPVRRSPEVEEASAALVKRAQRVFMPVFVVGGIVWLGLAATGHATAAIVMFVAMGVAVLGWNVWFLRWRSKLEAGALVPAPLAEPPGQSFGRRVLDGLQAMTISRPVAATSGSTVDDVVRALDVGAEAEGATFTAMPATGDGILIVSDLRVANIRNDVHVSLEGQLTWSAPGHANFDGRIGPRGQTRFWAAFVLLFLVGGLVLLVTAPLRFLIGDDPFAAGFFTLFGATTCAIAIWWALQFAQAGEAHRRVLRDAFGDNVRVGRAPS
jgi:hypothetical protein